MDGMHAPVGTTELPGGGALRSRSGYFAGQRGRQWESFSPRSLARGVEETTGQYTKMGGTGIGSLVAFRKAEINTACETEISFHQYVWGTEQDWLSFICKQ